MGWKEFEQLAAQIYSELSPTAKVTHNDKVLGIDSGVDRQIDVSIRFKIAGHDVLVVIQARDHDSPADINDVGEFATVAKDIRANKGILICRSGFTNGANKLARNLGMDLCRIHDAQSRDWSLEIELPILWIDLFPNIQFQMIASFEAGDSFSKNPENWGISTDKGATRITPIKSFIRAWNERQISQEVGKVHGIRDPNLSNAEILVHDVNGEPAWRPITRLGIVYTVSRRAWLGSFTPEECRGVLNIVDGTFTVSYLPIGEIPLQRDEDWQEIEDPDQLAVTIPGTIITTEGWQIDRGDAKVSDVSFVKIDPSDEDSFRLTPRWNGPEKRGDL